MENDAGISLSNSELYESGKKQLSELNDALIQAYRSFNSVSDPTAVDNCISDINSLRARRNSVLRELRQLEPTRKEKIWNSYQASS